MALSSGKLIIMNNTLNVVDSNLIHNSSNELQIHVSKITAVEKDPFAEYI